MPSRRGLIDAEVAAVAVEQIWRLLQTSCQVNAKRYLRATSGRCKAASWQLRRPQLAKDACEAFCRSVCECVRLPWHSNRLLLATAVVLVHTID